MQRTAKPQEPLQWDDVRLFLALCRARTVGVAAGSLRVDASTVSRRLAALEAQLDVRLFDRGRDGITPTEAADDLMPVAEEMEAVMNRFATAAEGLEREVTGVVRITCPPDVAAVLVAPLLGELLATYPALHVMIDPREEVVDLTRREADLALRTVRPTRGDLVVTRLTSVRWVLAATPEIAAETLTSWKDVAWVGWGERLANIGPARWLARHGNGIEPAVRSDSLGVQLAVVATGAGVALLPEPSLEYYGLAPVKLAPPLRKPAAEWPVDELFLVTHRVLRDVPRVRVVWDLLVARAGERRAAPVRARNTRT